LTEVTIHMLLLIPCIYTSIW